MRVFVHMNYGRADVYNAETDEDLAFIYDTLYNMLEDFGEELDRHLRPCERYVLELIDQFAAMMFTKVSNSAQDSPTRSSDRADRSNRKGALQC